MQLSSQGVMCSPVDPRQAHGLMGSSVNALLHKLPGRLAALHQIAGDTTHDHVLPVTITVLLPGLAAQAVIMNGPDVALQAVAQ